MASIESIVPTTITVSHATRERLADYKRGDMTYDDVLRLLMDRVPLAEVAAEAVEEHSRRLEDGDFVTADQFKAILGKRLKAGRTRGRS